MVKLNATESTVYDLIQRGAKDTNALIARMGKSRRVILQAVHKLLDVGYIEKLGAGRMTTYRVMKKGA